MTRWPGLIALLSLVAFADDGGLPAGFVRLRPGAESFKTGVPRFPATLPVAVLDGDPSKPGPFTVRVKLARGAVLAPHTHPCDERTTVLSGAVLLGVGTTLEPAKLMRVEAGGFYVNPKGAAHSLQAEDDTVLQVACDGPWGSTPAK